ncbi:MAG: hypothetical protein JXR04_10715 [Bermanella sp.]
MDLRIALVSSLLISSSAYSAVDNNIIKSKEASHITLAGRIGEAAMFSVQADDDDRAEIFVTASSIISSENDHWLLLDWNGTGYEVINRGNLQPTSHKYLSSFQISKEEILLGHQNGLLTTIQFTDNPSEDAHTISEKHSLLSNLPNDLDKDDKPDVDIMSIVSIQGSDLNNYIAICSKHYIHIYENEGLRGRLATGGYCQTGNIDYQKLSIDNSTYDQELIIERGYYFNFNGIEWTEKTGLAYSEFGDNFKVANIDDDAADEILSQKSGQLQSFSPQNSGSWVYISALQDAKFNFNAVDIDNDGISEIIFDSFFMEPLPSKTFLNLVSWNTINDTHSLSAFTSAPYRQLTKAKKLATIYTGDIPSGFSLFVSNIFPANPNTFLLTQLDPSTLSVTWSGLSATATRSFDSILKTSSDLKLSDIKVVQVEEDSYASDTDQFAFKYLDGESLTFEMKIQPSITDNDLSFITSLATFDMNDDGIDELHIGGQASSAGVVVTSNYEGNDYSKLVTPSIQLVDALFVGNINNAGSPDVLASGPATPLFGEGISLHSLLDSSTESQTLFTPGSKATSFKKLTAANIKGTPDFEILGLHSQLASIDLNAGFLDSNIYNLSSLNFSNFTPITLYDREYDYALASDTNGMLYFIEPKDFDILSSVKACNTKLSTIKSIEINNKANVVFAICNQSLLSWVLNYNTSDIEFGYTLEPLKSFSLGNGDTSDAQLYEVTTNDGISHLFVLLKNQFLRLTLNKSLSDDTDTDGILNYKDMFPNDITQWADSDQDSLGDNPAGNNPDPSLYDIDNDGVLDANDPDNQPENDLDPSNDSDHGTPAFVSTFETMNVSQTATLTNISLSVPTASDVFDDYYGNGPLTISAAISNNPLSLNADDKYEATLETGRHIVKWDVTDLAGNSNTAYQTVNVYPTLSFTQNQTIIGENQEAIIEVALSGESPIYPVTAVISVTQTSANNADINEDISSNLVVNFATGELTKTITLSAIDDEITETNEELTLTITDSFLADTWTVNPTNNQHQLTIVDVNTAPTVDISVEQKGIITTAPNHIDGNITLTSNITDIDSTDTHTYLWDLNSLGLGESLLSSVQINPEVITPGIYTITLTVTDNGLPAKSTMETFTLNYVYGDSDSDGVADNLDAFPQNPDEWDDKDGDGYGDRFADKFPDDATEHADDDNDGTGNNADPFDDDPNETKDTDNDGVGDNSDKFPRDYKEQIDTDGDGVGDNSDIFPTNPNEQYDTDGDGVGNNADAFPNDPKETVDSDGDRVGDNSDKFPLDPKRSKEETSEKNEEDEGFGSGGALSIFWLFLLIPVLLSGRRKL